MACGSSTSALTRIGPWPGREDRAPRLWGHSSGSASNNDACAVPCQARSAMQGFYFNKPIAEGEFAEFLRQRLAASGADAAWGSSE